MTDPGSRRIAILLFAFLSSLFVLTTRGHFITTDEVLVYQGTQGLWQSGRPTVQAHDTPENLLGRDGRNYAQYNSGLSIAALPLYAVGSGVESLLRAAHFDRLLAAFKGQKIARPGVVWGGECPIFFVNLFNAFSTALLCSIFFLFTVDLGVSRRTAAQVALLLGCTSYMTALSSGFMQHTSEALCTLLAFHLLFIDSQAPRWTLRAGAGAAIAAMLQIRFPSLFAVPALFLYASLVAHRRHRTLPLPARLAKMARELTPLLLVTAAGFLLHFADQLWKFGTLRTVGYSGLQFDHSALIGIYGFLFSLGESIFLFTPLLILALPAIYIYFKTRRDEAIFIVVYSSIFMLAYSTYQQWPGGSFFGPRYVSTLVPILLLPLGSWLTADRRRWRVVAPLALFGGGLQILQLAVNWWSVIREEKIHWAAPFEHLYVPEKSQLAGAVRGFLAFDWRVDFWLLNVFRNQGLGLCIALTALLLVPLSLFAVLLQRAMRAEVAGADS